MTPDPLEQAEILEELLPEVIRTLFPGSDNEPLSDLPVSQLRVLRLLWKSPRTSTELAELLSISPPAVAQVLAKLEAADLISKVLLEHDRRAKSVELSVSGRCLMLSRRTMRTARAARILQSIEASDRESVIKALRKLAALPSKPT